MLPGSLFVTILACLLGLVVYAFYEDCDPVISNRIKKKDQVRMLKYIPTFYDVLLLNSTYTNIQ